MANLSQSVVRMSGRDPGEAHRASTPLELLFDLTFVIAFGVAANELSHALVENHVRDGIVGFVFATFAISWAWIQYSWFASAYDTDDWLYRLMTMAQMVGVLILALGLHDMFASLTHHERTLNNGVMVLGYIVMRVPMIGQWLRAAKHDPLRRRTCRTYVVTILISQILWCALIFLEPPLGATFALMLVPVLIELAGPYLAETRLANTPWHPHHIAERYGLLIIIALGEGMIGTMAAMNALLSAEGWSLDFVLVLISGVALTFGIWWVCFVIPNGELLAAHRERAFGWGYGHIPLFGAVVAVGAGLHVAAYYLEQHTHLGALGTLVAVAAPLLLFLVCLFAIYWSLIRACSAANRAMRMFHWLLLVCSFAVAGVALSMAALDASFPWSLLVLSLTPWVTVLGYQLRGYRHNEDVLAAL